MKDIYINIKDYSFKKKFNKDLVSLDDILDVLEDLFFDCERLEEKIEDIENDMEHNYKPILPSEQYGINDKDFI